MRICSLLPSATEIVCALDLGKQLVAVSHECDYPEYVMSKPKATRSLLLTAKMRSGQIDKMVSHHMSKGRSLYGLDTKLLEKLRPELILTQELCRVCAVSYDEVLKAARILQGNPRIVSLEPRNLEEIFENILLVGELTDRKYEADKLITQLRSRMKRILSHTETMKHKPKVFCMEWIDPPWVAGHWVPEMVRIAGGVDDLGKSGEPSIKLEWEKVVQYAPEIIVLMPCGFSVRRTVRESAQLADYPGWRELPAVKAERVYAVDASSYFSRSGPRVVDGVEILTSIIHPDIMEARHPDAIEHISSKSSKVLIDEM